MASVSAHKGIYFLRAFPPSQLPVLSEPSACDLGQRSFCIALRLPFPSLSPSFHPTFAVSYLCSEVAGRRLTQYNHVFRIMASVSAHKGIYFLRAFPPSQLPVLSEPSACDLGQRSFCIALRLPFPSLSPSFHPTFAVSYLCSEVTNYPPKSCSTFNL